jgi:hypothetical protein
MHAERADVVPAVKGRLVKIGKEHRASRPRCRHRAPRAS